MIYHEKNDFYISPEPVFNKGIQPSKITQSGKGEDLMEILKTAIAGTLESSDAQVTVEPGEQEIKLSIESSVMNQYGRQIKAAVLETLGTLGVNKGIVKVVDKGALECTLKARVQCAVYRSCGASEKNIPWGGMAK